MTVTFRRRKLNFYHIATYCYPATIEHFFVLMKRTRENNKYWHTDKKAGRNIINFSETYGGFGDYLSNKLLDRFRQTEERKQEIRDSFIPSLGDFSTILS